MEHKDQCELNQRDQILWKIPVALLKQMQALVYRFRFVFLMVLLISHAQQNPKVLLFQLIRLLEFTLPDDEVACAIQYRLVSGPSSEQNHESGIISVSHDGQRCQRERRGICSERTTANGDDKKLFPTHV